MAKQQQKRRRKRYRAGSAYAGDVRPTGVLGFMGSARMIRVVFIFMALALGAGSFVGIFGLGFGSSGGHSGNQGFNVPDDDTEPTPASTEEATNVRQFTDPPEMTIDPAKSYVATIRTDAGDIEVELFAGQAPQTVNNFVFLAREGFYSDLIFHYVQDGFSAQAGDPNCTANSASNCRGDGGPGYELAQEAPGEFEKGTLGMLSETGSQFFIALGDSDTAGTEYEQFTPFGQITSGLNVAERLTQGVEIQSIEISET